MAPIDFWFSIGSTYSYLAVMRLAGVSERSGVAFTWRPFSVRAIMREMGNIPFADKPAKLKYMWRDIGRFAAEAGLSPKLPAPYPLKEFDMANRVAIVGREEGWCEAYVRAAYRGWFERGEPAGEEPNLSASIRAAGQDPARVIGKAAAPETEAAYLAATQEARALGIFGAPTFVTGGELFWGNDRLDSAIAWHRSH